jgi:Flp pilus assembly pilin Flp
MAVWSRVGRLESAGTHFGMEQGRARHAWRATQERDDMNLINHYLPYMRAWLRKESGQDLMEYALLVALISLVCVAILTSAGGAVQTIFQSITGQLQNAGATP